MNKVLKILLILFGIIFLVGFIYFSSIQNSYDYEFDEPQQFIVDVNSSEGGYVYTKGNAIEGTYYLVLAMPDSGYKFVGWNEPHQDEGRGIHFQMSRNHSYYANFVKW